jgi:hypothetical protein
MQARVSIVNQTSGSLSDEDVQTVIRAINRQIATDFGPAWGKTAQLRLEGRGLTQGAGGHQADVRGEAVIYLWEPVDVDGALGFYQRNHRGIPFGVVFTELSQELGESWSVTLSHEALELIADPQANTFVAGPHPSELERDVFFWFAVADPVQAETYLIDGVEVSNFVLPLYFHGDDDAVGRSDFLARLYRGRPLSPFGVNPGGYVGFVDPLTGRAETFSLRGDEEAAKRLSVNRRGGQTNRVVRRQRFELRHRDASDGRRNPRRRNGPELAAVPGPS